MRKLGERGFHGTALQAIGFAISSFDPDMYLQEREFLTAWLEGDLDEWPLYYEWAQTQEGALFE